MRGKMSSLKIGKFGPLLSKTPVVKYNNFLLLNIFLVLLWTELFLTEVNSASNRNLRRQSETCGKLDLNPKDIRTAAPWHVAIFRKVGKGDFEYFTGGTVFAPGLVFGVQVGPAGAFLRDKKPQNFFIAAGVNSTDLTAIDKFTQFRRVTLIQSFRQEWLSNIYYHDVVYHLEKPLDMSTPVVREICLPLFLANPNARLPTNLPYLDYTFVLVGFSKPLNGDDPNETRKLRALRVGSIQPNVCGSLSRFYYKRELPMWCLSRGKDKKSRDYSYTKIVDELKAASVEKLTPEEEDALCLGHGSQSTLALGSFWYSGIMISVIPGNKRGRCNRNTIYGGAISDSLVISNYQIWLHNQHKCGEAKYACGDGRCIPLSQVCNGEANCPDNSDEYYGDCATSQNPNFEISGNLSQNSNSKLEPLRQDLTMRCPDLKLGPGIACFQSGTKTRVDCNVPKFAGTRIRIECDEFHSTPKFTFSNLELHCNNFGKWNNLRQFHCEKECGQRIIPSRNRPDLSEEDEEKYSGFPWEAAIFVNNVHMCGATLIESNFVLTHPRCIKPYLENIETRLVMELVIRPTGSVYSQNFPADVIQPIAQSYRIRKVFLPDGGRNFDEGIALLQFDGIVETHGRNKPGPVCYLANRFKPSKPTQNGAITVLRDASAKENPLEFLNVTVISKKECEGVSFGGKAIGENQFCTSLNNSKSSTKSSEGELKLGTGLIFKQLSSSTGRTAYAIKGILNEIHPNHLVFSHVYPFSDWMMDILERES